MYHGEWSNTITHLVGTVLAIVGTAVLIPVAATNGNARSVAALSVYGAMLIFLYLSSTLYHSLRGRAKQVFHVFDHCAIYLLIAGTYTPLTLITLRSTPAGWRLFLLVWTLALLGIARDVFLRGGSRALPGVLYLLMGWLVVGALGPLRRSLPAPAIAWLAVGGLFYTAGLAFFALSKRVAHTHGFWHLCVIGGSACHYFTVLRYVAQAR
jgi:hemolysin III